MEATYPYATYKEPAKGKKGLLELWVPCGSLWHKRGGISLLYSSWSSTDENQAWIYLHQALPYLVVLSPELWYPLLLLKPDILIQVDLEEAEKLLLPSPPPLTISSSGPGPGLSTNLSLWFSSSAILEQILWEDSYQD